MTVTRNANPVLSIETVASRERNIRQRITWTTFSSANVAQPGKVFLVLATISYEVSTTCDKNEDIEVILLKLLATAKIQLILELFRDINYYKDYKDNSLVFWETLNI